MSMILFVAGIAVGFVVGFIGLVGGSLLVVCFINGAYREEDGA